MRSINPFRYQHRWHLVQLLSSFLFIFSATLSATPAPDFAVTVNGQATTLQALTKAGKVVYVDFWASWCGPCRKSFPWMAEITKRYEKSELVVIAVNVDSDPSLATAFLDEFPVTFPIVYDPEGNIANAYQLMGMPSSYLIDSQGEVVQQHKGFSRSKIPQYEAAIVQLLDTHLSVSKE